MKSYDFFAVIYTDGKGDSDIFCTGCLPEGVDVESSSVYPIFADSEWDYYPSCCVCGEVHDYVSLLLQEE